MSCHWPAPGFNYNQFNTGTDLMLVSATAYEIINDYPVTYGTSPGTVVIQVDREFSVLTDSEGNILLGAEK